MAYDTNSQVAQCFCYLMTLILALGFFVPMVMNVSEFNGKCLLFTTGTFNESDGRIFEPNWANFSYCGLTLFNGFFLTTLSLIQFIRIIRLISNGKKGTIISFFWDSVISLFAVLITLINAFLVSFGFSRWCNSLSQNFESCEDAADSKVLIISNTDIKPERFYTEMSIIIVSIWNCLMFLALHFLAWATAFQEYHEKENLIISMAKKRRRYVAIEEDE